MAEGHGPVVGITLLQKHVTVEPAISGMANTPMPPKEPVGTGSTSPWAT